MTSYWENKKFLIIAFVLPILALAAVLVQKSNLRKLETGTFKVPIEGVDPRDLLAGHYLTYAIRATRIDNVRARIPTPSSSMVACFSQDEIVITAEKNHNCKFFVQLNSRNNLLFNADGLERYYFPDKYKDVLATVPAGSKMEITVHNGKARAVQMYIPDSNGNHDLTAEDWADMRLDE